MIATYPAKKRKISYLKWQRMVRKTWAMTKVKMRLVPTVIACPADRVLMEKSRRGQAI
jgi:hypothetical protein